MIPSSAKAVIFDLDGVLWETNEIHASAYSEVFAELGINEFDYAEFAGMSTPDCFKVMLARNSIPFDNVRLRELVQKKRSRSLTRLREDLPLKHGCPRVLESLSKKFRLALASSSSTASVEVFLKGSGTGPYFSVVLAAEDVRETKPSPEIYLRAAEKLGVHPGECVVVEDSENGIKAARAAGTQVIGILGTEDADVLIQAGADIVTDRLERLNAQ